jgi:DNA-binding Xre family transcriptional regulator
VAVVCLGRSATAFLYVLLTVIIINPKRFKVNRQNKLFLDYFLIDFISHKLYNVRKNIGGYKAMLVYKIDVLDMLKESGYNSTRILKENLISQSAVQKIRKNEMVGIKTIEKLCELLDMQPGNIIKYVEKK